MSNNTQIIASCWYVVISFRNIWEKEKKDHDQLSPMFEWTLYVLLEPFCTD